MVIEHGGISMFLAALTTVIYYMFCKKARNNELLLLGELAFILYFAAGVFCFLEKRFAL